MIQAVAEALRETRSIPPSSQVGAYSTGLKTLVALIAIAVEAPVYQGDQTCPSRLRTALTATCRLHEGEGVEQEARDGEVHMKGDGEAPLVDAAVAAGTNELRAETAAVSAVGRRRTGVREKRKKSLIRKWKIIGVARGTRTERAWVEVVRRGRRWWRSPRRRPTPSTKTSI